MAWVCNEPNPGDLLQSTIQECKLALACTTDGHGHLLIMGTLIALFLVALLLGGMIFFAAVMAPLVFTRLPADQAGTFIRQVFPVYYVYVAALSAAASIALAAGHRLDAALMALCAASTVWLRQGLMPMINQRSDAMRAGDASAKKGFDAMHRLSVVINFAQILVAGIVLARFAI